MNIDGFGMRDDLILFKQVPPRMTLWAIQYREKIVKDLGGRYNGISDEEWIGDVGEAYFKLWLEQKACPFIWVSGSNRSEFDFKVKDNNVDVKTQRMMSRNDQRDLVVEASVVEKKPDIDYLFFTRYMGDKTGGVIFLLGAMHWEIFLAHAEFREQGSKRSNGTVVAASEYGAPLKELVKPDIWLRDHLKEPA